MSKIEKLLAKYKQNPESISVREMITILKHNGYIGVNAEGSHTVYKKEGVAEHITLAIHNNKLKYGYATRFKKNFISGGLKKMNYKYKGKVYSYTIEELGKFVEGIESDWIRITCEEVGLKSEFLKEDLQDALEFLKLYINMSLEEDYTSEEAISVLGKNYKAKIHWLGKQKDGQVWVKVVCKGANYNQKHPKSDLQRLLNQELPHLISAQKADQKTETFQIRMTPSEKNKISTLAKKSGLNISEYLIKQALVA